ncbi:unnamed protein product [Auanema sp. JU1783]|nr:unnamed protein product [Auanema sp. JU1783]
MEQTTRGRAIAHELRAFENLLKSIPTSKESKETILLEDVSNEKVCISSLIPKDTTVNKCIVVFSQLVEETNKLMCDATERHFPTLLLYSEEALSRENTTESQIITSMAKFLPVLLDISSFISRVNEVFRNLLQQLRHFFKLDSSEVKGSGEKTFQRVWKALGELLSMLVQMDEIYLSRPITKQHWDVYRKAIESVQHYPSKFNILPEDITPLLSNLVLIEGCIMSGNGLRNCYEQCFGELDEDTTFATRMKDNITTMYQKWEKAAEVDVPEKRKLMAIVSLTVFYHLHFPKPSTKLLKTVWASHKKMIAFYLFGDILWSPCAFLLREVGDINNIVDKKSISLVQNFRDSFTTETFVTEAVALLIPANEWVIEISEEFSRAGKVDAARSLKLSEFVLRGVRLADTMSKLLKMILYGPRESLKLSKKMAFQVFEFIESVKAISLLLHKNWRLLHEAISLASQQWRAHILSMLNKLKIKAREQNDEDKVSALDTAIISMASSASRTRLTVCGISLEMAQYDKLLKPVDIAQMEGLLTRIHTLLQPLKLIERGCDCSFIFFQKVLFEIYWDTIYDRIPSDSSLKCFLFAQTDCLSLLSQNGSDEFYETVQNQLANHMRNGLLVPSCGLVENDLRVLTHKHLAVAEADKTSNIKLGFLRRLLKKPILPLYDKCYDVKEFVENYLETTFYDLTAVSLHDCHTYCKMALLAEERFGLNLISGDLPHHSIDQGLDIKYVILTLQQFTVGFNYCINHQIFVEKTSPNKTIRVVTSEHMTASLRTHGTGILNTSVNIVYQLLKTKFSILAQFLSDEHIRAQLQRDRRHFAEKKESYNHLYPVKRAEKFNKTLEKLGGDEEESYMDKLRELVTQVGNALGFVRTMSSAAYAINSQVKEYDVEFEDDNIDLSHSADNVLNSLNKLLSDVRESSSKNRNFMKMLVDVYRTALSKLSQLENFFMLVPPLLLNYLQHMLTCRERLKKRLQTPNKEMTFVDDGFHLGVAYLLTVLNQWTLFTDLQWMESLRRKLDDDGTEMTSKLAETRDRRSDALMANIVNSTFREYQQITYTFHSARVFFSFDDDESEP